MRTMTTLSCFVCALLVLIEIIFVPLYLKKMWPTKNWHSLCYKMVCATSYLLIAITAVISKGSLSSFSAMMLTGFCCSWLGDLMLHIPKPTKKYFIIGMVFFMTAHIFYCLGYLDIQRTMFGETPTFMLWEFIVCAVIILLYYIIVYAKGSRFGEMLIPCVIYGAFVTMMMIKSTTLGIKLLADGNTQLIIPAVMLLIGGTCFVQSDGSLALISFDTRYKKFRLKVYNIITYFAAQVCLAFTCFYF